MSSYTDTILPPRDSRGLPRWAIAGLIVLALHLVVGILIILKRSTEMPAGVPSNAVMIDLAPVAAAPSQPLAAPPQEQAPPPTQQAPDIQPKITTPVTPPPEPTPPPPQPMLQATPETPVVTTPPPPTPPAPQIVQVPEIPAVEPEVAMPLPSKLAPDKTQELKQKRLEQQRREKAERNKERAQRARAASERASRASRAAAGRPGVSRMSASAWASLVQARVNAAKRYPESARARGESGSATLAFTVDGNGRVVSASVVSSSGYSDLDRATVAMAHRLGHLPPPPNGRVTLRVRVNFSVR